MDKIWCFVLGVLCSEVVHAQFLLKGVCTATSRSSLSIQFVDENWNPIPFDCENTQVLIEGEGLTVDKEPGKFRFCPGQLYKNSPFPERQKAAVHVLFNSTGSFQVTVSRFDEVSTFKNVLIEQDQYGCHPIPQVLEVHFDMSKTQ